MVTDHQVRLLMSYLSDGKSLTLSAAQSGMNETTGRKYRDLNKLPSELPQSVREYKTRQSPFDGLWDFIHGLLSKNPGLQGRTILKYLIADFNGKEVELSTGDNVTLALSWSHLRTLQRGIKHWHATEGPGREVYFSQIYHPGERCQSDYTHMEELGVTINGQLFKHLIYHFVLPYSNWQTGSICFSESFESLSDGLQDALHKLSGVPKSHQTDQLSAAVHHLDNPEEFTDRYKALLKHYKLEGRKIQARKPNQNGDVEQSNRRFKEAVDQSLMLRGSRDFKSREAYCVFIRRIFDELNSACMERFREELKVLRQLPDTRLTAMKKLTARVGQGSTITINRNVYSVDSRLIGEKVTIFQYAEYLQVWYGQKLVDKLPRLIGRGKHHINYRHIIDSLVRKPGAFENYRYRADLFPTSRFRIVYDLLTRLYAPQKASKEYLKILHLAATESETKVDTILGLLLDRGRDLDLSQIKQMVVTEPRSLTGEVPIDDVDLNSYDLLLN